MRRHAAMAVLAVLTMPALAAPVTLPAHTLRYRPQVRGWAQVRSLSPLVLRTAVAGRVATIRVVPGEAVRAGQPLVTLAGPELDGELSAARARWRAARHELAAARMTVASARRTYPVVTDRKSLDAAQAGLAAAEGESAAAHAALETLLAQQTLSSPAAAEIDRVNAAPGADLSAGSPLVSLLPRGSLWLRAEVFGHPSLPATAAAHFVPDDGGPAIAVRKVAELPARAPDGARVFNFEATGSARWQAGETGKLIWRGSPRNAVAVPSEALVLDAGRWYVLTDVHGNLAAQAVIPGPTRGTDVLITKGLRAGVPVVVRQAYLLFHRDFSAQYAPPD